MGLKNSHIIFLIDKIINSIVFHDFIKSRSAKITRLCCRINEKKREFYINRVKKQHHAKVVFFFQSLAQWNYDKVYWRMHEDKHFDPIVVIIPFNTHIYYKNKQYLEYMDQAVQYAEAQGYKYISSYDKKKGKWLDIKKILDPDMLFFSLPYKNTLFKYHLYNFSDRITCYSSYSFFVSDGYRLNLNLPFHNMLWSCFFESHYPIELAKSISFNRGENFNIAGCLPLEQILDKQYIPKDVWEKQNVRKKRIIWAPHHTIDYTYNYSTFITYAEEMIRIAEKYKEQVQFAFKPHPVLKQKLVNVWGEEKTYEYYRKWQNMPNTQLEESEYLDLFLTSDAMIHDSASFLVEYMYVYEKPVLYLVKDEAKVYDRLNSLGREALDVHYWARCTKDIESFIEDILSEADDNKRCEREEFFNKYLSSKDGLLPSEKIVNQLKKIF